MEMVSVNENGLVVQTVTNTQTRHQPKGYPKNLILMFLI